MRQAGRILQPYRDLKKQAGSLSTLFNTPELAAQVTLMPVEILGVDAAILFADIFTPVEPMGCELVFQPGPVLASPVRTRSDVDRLRTIEPEEDLPHVRREIELVRAGLPQGVPLIGFAGAPVTLATYLAEGTGAREFTHFRRLLHADPDTADLLLTKLADVAITYLKMQVDAGVDAVQLFDTWIGSSQKRSSNALHCPAWNGSLRSSVACRSRPSISQMIPLTCCHCCRVPGQMSSASTGERICDLPAIFLAPPGLCRGISTLPPCSRRGNRL